MVRPRSPSKRPATSDCWRERTWLRRAFLYRYGPHIPRLRVYPWVKNKSIYAEANFRKAATASVGPNLSANFPWRSSLSSHVRAYYDMDIASWTWPGTNQKRLQAPPVSRHRPCAGRTAARDGKGFGVAKHVCCGDGKSVPLRFDSMVVQYLQKKAGPASVHVYIRGSESFPPHEKVWSSTNPPMIRDKYTAEDHHESKGMFYFLEVFAYQSGGASGIRAWMLTWP